MFAIPKSDALDVLLYGIGLRITQLAKMGDPKFKSLLDNRNFTIQMGSTEQDIYRTFTVENGRFTQAEGKTNEPTLSIDFKDSMTGAKLLTKGDATAFMMGVQNGDVKMSGDYSLLMWFNQIAKHIIPKIPEPLQPAVDAVKPIISKATPVAKELCDKGMALLAGLGLFGENAKATDEKDKDIDEKSEKEIAKSDNKKDNTAAFDQDEKEKTKDTTDSESKSFVDTAKEKLADIKADVEEKVDELKEKFDDVTETTKDKFTEVKAQAETKVEEVKEKAEDLTTQTKEKLDDIKSETQDKLDTAKDKVEEVKSDVQTKLDEAKSEIKDKTDDIKKDVADKVETAKDKMGDVTTDTKEKLGEVKAEAKHTLDDVKSEVKDKVENVTENTQSKFDELIAKAESDKEANNLTSSQQKSYELDEKPADKEVIADNVKTQAVQDDKSPITNILVTRNSDSK